MDIQEFNRRILQKRKQLEELVRRKMPVIAGNIAKRHIEDDFRKGGFTHNGFHPWQESIPASAHSDNHEYTSS